MYVPTNKTVLHYFDASSLTQDQKDAGYSESGYYFWLETFAHVEGPYPTAEEANEGLEKYIKSLGYN